MRCPACQVDNDKVTDSRSGDEGYSIRRRRECQNCGRRFTTYERLEEITAKVIKKDGVREDFHREKIRAGLEKACWKRPISHEQIESVIATIESEVYASNDDEVESRLLGKRVMELLARLDQVAYVRFASVYREFKDVRDFVDELTPILNQQQQEKS